MIYFFIRSANRSRVNFGFFFLRRLQPGRRSLKERKKTYSPVHCVYRILSLKTTKINSKIPISFSFWINNLIFDLGYFVCMFFLLFVLVVFLLETFFLCFCFLWWNNHVGKKQTSTITIAIRIQRMITREFVTYAILPVTSVHSLKMKLHKGNALMW